MSLVPIFPQFIKGVSNNEDESKKKEVKELSKHSDEELLQKLNSLEEIITYETKLIIHAGGGNEVIQEEVIGQYEKCNPEYIKVSDEIILRAAIKQLDKL